MLDIPGRTFPVEILYRKQPEKDYLQAAIKTALHIHFNEEPGDVLLFLTGEEEIESAVKAIREQAQSKGDQVPSGVFLFFFGANCYLGWSLFGVATVFISSASSAAAHF